MCYAVFYFLSNTYEYTCINNKAFMVRLLVRFDRNALTHALLSILCTQCGRVFWLHLYPCSSRFKKFHRSCSCKFRSPTLKRI